jgi:hypothetical protein
MGWLGSLLGGVKQFIGKVKPVLGGGIKIFDKMKGKYDNIKGTIANVPILGAVAGELIKQGEEKLANVIEAKTGINPAMIGKGISIARTVEGALPG